MSLLWSMELPSPLAALAAARSSPVLWHAQWSAQQESCEFCGPMSGRPKASRAGALPWPKIICQEGPARKKVWRQFGPAPHSLSHECHLQEAKEQDTSKKIAATRRLTSHNTLPDHDVLLRARLAQSHGRPGQQVGRIHVLRRGVGPLDQ